VIILMRAWQWATDHRPAWGLLAATFWALIVWAFVHDILIAAICGAAFGAISATTLPHPPDHPDNTGTP
jgi:hypothetical protein